MEEFSDEQIYEAMRRADAAGDADAVRALTAALQQGRSQDEIETMAANLGQDIDKGALAANVASRDAGGPVNQFVQALQTNVQAAGTSIANTAVGYGSGAAQAVIDAPLAIAGGVQTGANALLDIVIGGGLDAVGANNAADWWRNAGRIEEQRRAAMANPVDVAVNALAPAPAGYETQRNVAEFAGGFLVPGPKGAKAPISAPAPAAAQATSRVIPNALEVVAEGQKRGVPVMTTDIKPPKSGMGRMVKQTVPEKIPFAGMSGPRQAQQEERVRVVGELVEEFGGNAGRELFERSIGAVEDIAKSLSAERASRIATRKAAKDGVIKGIATPFSAAPNTVRAIDEQVARLNRIDDEIYAPVVDRLQRFKQQITSGKSLEDVEGQRRLLGAMFDDANLASIKDDGQKAINAIYDPLRRDMGDFIEQQAGAAARAKWAKANEELAAMAGELKSSRFKNVLRDADTTPEVVGRILFNDPNNASDMARLVENLPPAGQRKVQAALIQRAFDSAGGSQGVSVEQFLNNLRRNSEKFGVAFKGADGQTLEGVRRLLEATRRGAEAGANVRTGEQNLPTVLGIGATQVAGLGGGVTSLGVGGLLARIYESGPVRDRLIRLASTKQGSVQEGRALEIVMRSAAPIVNTWRESVVKAVNDNPAGRLAAGEQQPSEPQ